MLRGYIFNTTYEQLEAYKVFKDDTLLNQTVEEMCSRLPDAVKRCYAENPEYLSYSRFYIPIGHRFSKATYPSIISGDIDLSTLPEYQHVVKHYSDAYSRMIKETNDLKAEIYRMSPEEIKEKYPLAMLDYFVSRLTPHFQGDYDVQVYLNANEKIYSSMTIKSHYNFEADIKDFVNGKVYESLLNYYK